MPGSHIEPAEPYSVLAIGYDFVMDHVDYEGWAGYIYQLLAHYHPEARSVLELGCGTGMLALHLQALGGYDYLATDRSPTMVRVAQRKMDRLQVPIQIAEVDFLDFEIAHPVDVVLLLYDGMNYVLEEEDLARLLQCVHEALRPGGIFVFDQSTPLNSINNEQDFQDADDYNGFSYVRTSSYDADSRLHTTRFDLEVKGQHFVEEHIQRAYELAEMTRIVQQSPFRVETIFDGFTDEPADENSERVHWVLRRDE